MADVFSCIVLLFLRSQNTLAINQVTHDNTPAIISILKKKKKKKKKKTADLSIPLRYLFLSDDDMQYVNERFYIEIRLIYNESRFYTSNSIQSDHVILSS